MTPPGEKCGGDRCKEEQMIGQGMLYCLMLTGRIIRLGKV